ncbi:MAG TPA: 16S rRNA (cytosine(1402)-N(4))-methyltransferase, partial [Candidatus Woesebacteria bacterium]|nr:16S rRNA (cytosine(1402)-N(4))-methyltransferase [Candidatus Woesebacteria bacterium]
KEIEVNNLGKLLNKKAITASLEELRNNPRSRSAKLRAVAI